MLAYTFAVVQLGHHGMSDEENATLPRGARQLASSSLHTYGRSPDRRAAAEEFSTALKQDGMLASPACNGNSHVESPYARPRPSLATALDAALSATSGRTTTTMAMGKGSPAPAPDTNRGARKLLEEWLACGAPL